MVPPAGPVDEQGNSLAGWMPTRWTWQATGPPVLDWCDLDGLRLTAPFFAQTVQDAQDRSRTVRRTNADALAPWPDDGPGARPSGLIFHLSRCGSTLAAQALAASPENIVLSEPDVVDAVLRTGVFVPGVTDEHRAGWLRGLAKVYGRRRYPEERRFFVKFDTWHTLDIAVVRRAFPGVPWVFLYRDPVEIVVSQLHQVSGRMLPGPETAAWLGMNLFDALQTSQEEFCAQALGRIASAAAEAAAHDPLGRLVNYSELPDALESVVAPWFGVDLSHADRETMRSVTRYHAKSPGRLVFQPDAARKQRDAGAELRAVVQRWVGPAYTRLEEMRGQQRA